MTFSTKTEAEIIKSIKIVKHAAQLVGIIKDDTPADEVVRVSKELTSKIKTSVVENTGFIIIKVRYSNPHLASALANALAKSYIDEHICKKNREATKVMEFLERQLDEKRKMVEEAEENLREYQEENAEFFALALAYKDRLNLIDQDISRLTEIYTSEHRKVKVLQKETDKIRKKLKDLPQKEQKLNRREDEAIKTKTTYDKINDELIEAKIANEIGVEDITIVSLAIPSLTPINPMTKMNILIGLIVGLILGFIFVFVSESLDASIATIEEVENYLAKPVIGVIPRIKVEGGIGLPLLVTKSPEGSLFAAWNMIYTNIDLAIQRSNNIDHQTFMLTSTVPNEGKTVAAINLAIVSAHAGKRTLLVDMDTKRPSIHKIFNILREPGFMEFMDGKVKLNEATKRISHLVESNVLPDENILKNSEIDNLYIMPYGHIPANEVEAINSANMKSAIEGLKDEFEVIIFDCTPTLTTAATSVIASKLDLAILVYEVGKTARHSLKRAITHLSYANINVLGVILNKMRTEDLEPGVGYYYKYSYKYGVKKD
ncbi:MAG: AAA family ATPase [Candidatus Stahlbacteria bacterium]|nr:AAA family ATPase [Candidatus Stahlbacteria bacterium]